MVTPTEQAILDNALQAVRVETGMQIDIDKVDATLQGNHVDALLKIGQGKTIFSGEIKKWAPQANLGGLIERVKKLPAPGLLIADFINPKMATKLRQEEVQYIDTVGNAYINVPPTYVYVTGKRQNTANEWLPTVGETNRAFEPKGLKVIFTFLCEPDYVNAPYRAIAAKAGVAVGTVGWVIKGLKELDFIRNKGGGMRHLVNVATLLARWVDAYPQKLKPKQWVGRFIAEDPNWWKNVDIKKYAGQWGGGNSGSNAYAVFNPTSGHHLFTRHAGNTIFREHPAAQSNGRR